MAFPYDFGFVPSTRADDGDAVDAKDKERNDRIVAIEQENHSYAHVRHVKDLGKEFVRELEEFFVNYHELTGKKYRILDVKGPSEAWRRIEDGMKKAGRRR